MKNKISQRKLLLDLKELLNNFNIDFCLMSGTLLGAYRDKSFISWDNKDTDLAIDVKHYWKIKRILKESNWKYKAMWRREISIYKGDYIHPHIDLFFYETKGDKIYLYSNKVDKGFTNKWNVEQKHVFDKNNILPLVNYKFLNSIFKIPNKTASVLEQLYGETWKHPNSKWDGGNTPNIDKSHRQIAVIIPSFIRWGKTQKEVETLLDSYNPDKYRIYIGNQGQEDLTKIKFFNDLVEQGHYVTKLPYNCGLSYARNYLIKKTKEPYIMVIDNDFLFYKTSNLDAFAQILEDDENIGIVAGKLEKRDNYTHNLIYSSNEKKIIYLKTNPKNIQIQESCHRPNQSYFYTDLVLNFFLAKREVFNDIQWDDGLKLVEHTDFFMRLKRTKWKPTHAMDVIAGHQDIKTNTKEYTKFRCGTNKQIGWNIFLKKWGLSSIEDIKTMKDDILSYDTHQVSKPEIDKFRIIPKVEKYTLKQRKKYKKYKKLDYLDNKEIIKILVEEGYKVCLMNKTCAQAVKMEAIDETELHLAVDNIKEVSQLFNLKKLILYRMPRKTKPWGLYGKLILVPFPVIGYLKKLRLI